MADGPARRRRGALDNIQYRQILQRLTNFVDNELGNAPTPPERPDVREWKIQRAQTIETLNEFRAKLDTICVNANYGKAVGNGAEIVGIFAAMAGAVMSLFGITYSPKVTNVGNLVQNAGSFLGGISDTIESYISAKYLREIADVLKRDEELSLPLAEWLQYSRRVENDVQEIFGVSLTSGTLNPVIQTFQEILRLSSHVKDFNGLMRLMKQGRYSVYIGNDVKIEKLEKLYQYLVASPQFKGKINRILSSLNTSTKNVELFINGVRAYYSFKGISSSSAVRTLQGGLKPEIPTTGEVSAFCFFQAISLSISVISFINTANIIKDGTSKYSDKLKELTSTLNYELEQMENL